MSFQRFLAVRADYAQGIAAVICPERSFLGQLDPDHASILVGRCHSSDVLVASRYQASQPALRTNDLVLGLTD